MWLVLFVIPGVSREFVRRSHEIEALHVEAAKQASQSPTQESSIILSNAKSDSEMMMHVKEKYNRNVALSVAGLITAALTINHLCNTVGVASRGNIRKHTFESLEVIIGVV